MSAKQPDGSPSLKNCDVVMKGGITSGVVYPPAIIELAKEYRFKNIGGASAGALAAAATAAAEYGRWRGAGPDAGFALYATLPQQLAAPGFLIRLFTPASGTARGFRVLLRIMQAKSNIGRIVKGIWALLSNFVGGALLGVAVSLAVIVLVMWGYNFNTPMPVQKAVLLLIGTIWTFVATLLVTFATAVVQTARSLVANGYGFCSGFSKAPGAPHLTNWMHETLNRLADLPPEKPLTFGHLWTADGSNGATKAINLEVITTNLTHLAPYTIPFRGHEFYFDPMEWRQLFPDSVVQWMVEHARPGPRPVMARENQVVPLLPLPPQDDLPVVVAARLSVSFPGLVSAIPLYAVDFSLKCNQDNASTLFADRCWFSDGGICSNFPVHFFDAPIPRWPTFAINLKELHPEYDTEGSDFVYLPESCRGGQLASWRRFNPTGKGFADLRAFVSAILNTMMNWRDNLQTRMPGYRNRIVHISLKPNEGGLNVAMPPDLVKALMARGETAGRKLRTLFDFKQHVWTRYRLTMAMLDAYLHEFHDDYAQPPAEAAEIWKIITGGSASETKCYTWKSANQRISAVAATKDIVNIGEAWSKAEHPLQDGAPKPEPRLRAQPLY